MPAPAASPDVLAGVVMFTDIVGFTEFTAIRGDDEALQLLGVQESIVQSCMPPGARLVKELGDGLLLWFDDACAAVETALLLQERFETHSADSMLPLWVRIGMHWGRPTPRRGDIVGHDVNVAARIVDVAGPGEVVLSEPTVAALERQPAAVAFEELGPVLMKGIPDPVRLYRASR